MCRLWRRLPFRGNSGIYVTWGASECGGGSPVAGALPLTPMEASGFEVGIPKGTASQGRNKWSNDTVLCRVIYLRLSKKGGCHWGILTSFRPLQTDHVNQSSCLQSPSFPPASCLPEQPLHLTSYMVLMCLFCALPLVFLKECKSQEGMNSYWCFHCCISRVSYSAWLSVSPHKYLLNGYMKERNQLVIRLCSTVFSFCICSTQLLVLNKSCLTTDFEHSRKFTSFLKTM